MFKKILGFMVILGCTLGVAAGEQVKTDSSGTYYLDEIVVTAIRVERSVKDVSSTVSVVTEADIEASNSNSCLDILNTLPGVFINKTGDYGRADVDIRGIGDRGRRVMVLTDGRPVKMGLFGCTVTHTLPMNNVDRVEVVRGPSSVLYGSDALGGVINIITRRARKGFETELSSSLGAYNSRHIRLRHGGRRGKGNYYLTGDWRESDGHLPNSSYLGKDATLLVEHELMEGLEATLSAKYFDGRKEEPQLDERDKNYAPLPSDAWNEYRRGAVDVTFSGKFGRREVMAKGYRNFGDHLFSDGWDSKDYTDGAILHVSGPLSPSNSLTLGFEFRHQGGEVRSGPLAGVWNKREHAFFFHDEQILMKHRAILAFGARYNNDQVAGGEFCPQVGLVYHLSDETTLRGSANKGFRAPQINELYIFPAHNRNLTSEVVWNYEVGLNRQITPGLKLDLVGYLLRGENLIQLAADDSVPPVSRFQNIGEFEFRGIEANLHVQPFGNFQARISYTHLDPGVNTTGRPGEKVDLSWRWILGRLTFYSTGQYVTNGYAEDGEEEPIPAYLVMDTKLSYQILPGLGVFWAVNNVFNDEYVTYANLPGNAAGLYAMPRRNWATGLNLRL